MDEVCEGPLVWFDEPGGQAILECARRDCGYIIVTGSWHDERHSNTPLLREGIAAW